VTSIPTRASARASTNLPEAASGHIGRDVEPGEVLDLTAANRRIAQGDDSLNRCKSLLT
jgi:hypothetical protein